MTVRNYFGVAHTTMKVRLKHYVQINDSKLFQVQYEEIYSDLISNRIDSLYTKQIFFIISNRDEAKMLSKILIMIRALLRPLSQRK